MGLCNALIALQSNLAEDGANAFKYHMSLTEGNADFFLYTEDMADLFEGLYNNCQEFVTVYEYYSKKRKPLPNNPQFPKLDLDG